MQFSFSCPPVLPCDYLCGSQVFLDLAEKDMKQINALFREVFYVYDGVTFES